MNALSSPSFLARHHRLIFYSCWLLLGLVQSGLTELQDDEAYYWVYGRFLDWGYFDHPPMIGLLTKMGYALLPNELGVRLFPLLLHVLSLMIIEGLTARKNPFLFYGITLSLAVLQVAGFMAVPDIPLIFFAALFFLCYKRFIDTASLLNTLLLGVSIALLFYSKYHAVLIVLFALFSNIRLFTRYQVWLAGIIALLLFTPHLWWQYQHDWVSFRYHLFESNVNAYKPSYTIEYIVGQLLLPGPLAGIIILPAAILYKPANPFERALKVTMIGIYLFFLLSSFRGRVEGNWTSPVMVPLMVLSHQYLYSRRGWQKWLYRLLPVTLAIVLFARIIMIADIVPVKEVKTRYHSWKKWPEDLKEKTHGLPVVFPSYQRASKYWFYTGRPAYSLNSYKGRKNNYNFWPVEDSMLGRPVYHLDIYDLYRFTDTFRAPTLEIGYRFDPAFVSFTKIRVNVAPKEIRVKENAPLHLSLQLDIPPHYAAYIRNHPAIHDTTRVGIFNNNKLVKEFITGIRLADIVNGGSAEKQWTAEQPLLPKGKYFMRIGISAGDYPPTHNSDKIALVVE